MASNRRDETLRVVVLQGGGALGAYQAGVGEALHELRALPHWIAGISIGAINAAIVAGNPPERRLERLRMFWERVTSGVGFEGWWPNDQTRALFSETVAAWGTITGANGFFVHHVPPRALYPAIAPGPISYYDTSPLKETLLDLVDFDLINARAMRLSVGAVDVESGNFVYFDNHEREIRPEHIMASGALPPGFPPVEIDGRHYWDGGLVSNTPLQYVLDCATDEHIEVLQVDLFPARGPLPKTLVDVSEREKDIRYSSRTRLNTDQQVELHRTKAALRRLAKKLPPELRDDADVLYLTERAQEPSISILQIVYCGRPHEGGSKDYEFSRASMLEHWAAGAEDARRSLNDPEWTDRKRGRFGVAVYDLTRDRPSQAKEA